MKKYILVILLPFFLIACNKENSQYTAQLDEAQQYIEVHPDSALQILQSFTLNNLHTSAGKARYALLKSMALDKNYIDVTSDSLISIALSYYRKHGTSDEKMRAYYYNGIICLNKLDYEGAMANFINSEKYVKESFDYVSVGRLYNVKALVYSNIFNVDMAIEPAKLSVYYYLKGKDTVRYITGLNNLAVMYLNTKCYDSLDVCLAKINQVKRYMRDNQISDYFSTVLNYKRVTDNPTLVNSINDYLHTLKESEGFIKWHIVADAYLAMNNLSMSKWALDKYDIYYNSDEKSSVYYYISSEHHKELGDYKKAYDLLKMYQNKSSEKDLKIFQSDTKFLEERYRMGEKVFIQKLYIVIISLCAVIFVLVSYFIVRFYRDISIKRMRLIKEVEEQKDRLCEQYEKALIEKKKLRSLIEEQNLNEDMKRNIERRLSILNRFIVSNVSGIDMDKSIKMLNHYMENNDDFLNSTRMSYEVTHPNFISYLSNKGLSQWEIGCCCLYCLGMNGNEISNYLDIKYFYKKSSIIRKKLGIHSINIDTFLISKASELS